jgi:hypothetical protein
MKTVLTVSGETKSYNHPYLDEESREYFFFVERSKKSPMSAAPLFTASTVRINASKIFLFKHDE